MSDLTSLSGEYAENAEFVRRFNGALLAVRKEQMRPQTAASGSNHAKALARLVKELAYTLEHPTSDLPDAVPRDVIERLKERHRSDLSWFIRDLRDVVADLTNGTQLQPKQIARLEDVCEAADAAATAVFRRLWRR
jgi:hypothetical protein